MCKITALACFHLKGLTTKSLVNVYKTEAWTRYFLFKFMKPFQSGPAEESQPANPLDSTIVSTVHFLYLQVPPSKRLGQVSPLNVQWPVYKVNPQLFFSISNLVDVLLWATKRGGLPSAQHISPESCLALCNEVDFAEDRAAQQDVDPGVEDLVPRGQPHAHHHQSFVAGKVFSNRACVGVDHRHQGQDLQETRACNY